VTRSWRVALAAVLVATVAAVTVGCAEGGPEPEWDYATYPGQEPVAFMPVPGADLETWRVSIESLGVEDWGRAGVADSYFQEKYAPVEDERIDAERRVWSAQRELDGEVSFFAQAVTDDADALLFVYCEVSSHRETGGAVEPAAWEALTACAGGGGNSELDAAELSTWAEKVLPGFVSQPGELHQPRVERLQSGPVQAFLTDDGLSHTALSVSVDSDSAETPS
jgi:hypothetical protein